jgi:hypothetical protein
MTLVAVKQASSPNCVRTFVHHTNDDESVLKTEPTSKSNTENTNTDSTKDIDDLTQEYSSGLSMKKNSIEDSEYRSPHMTISNVRNTIFHILIYMGTLSSHFVNENQINDNDSDVIGNILGKMIVSLIDISYGLSINLHDACMKKIKLNQRKYPVELCKVCTTFILVPYW